MFNFKLAFKDIVKLIKYKDLSEFKELFLFQFNIFTNSLEYLNPKYRLKTIDIDELFKKIQFYSTYFKVDIKDLLNQNIFMHFDCEFTIQKELENFLINEILIRDVLK